MKERTIDATSLGRALDEGRKWWLLDVRTPAEFAVSRIEGAVSMPLDRLDPAAVRRAAEGMETCVLVCQRGLRARQAMARLEEAGCRDLAVLDGGMLAWRRAGLPVSGGGVRFGPRLVFGLLLLAALALGHWLEPGFYGLAVFAAFGLVSGGLPCCCGSSAAPRTEACGGRSCRR